MQKYHDTVQSRNSGRPVSGASVLVKTLAGVTATIYSDNGVTPVSNPLTTDANGYFSFYAADGRYTLTISGAGIDTRTISDVLLEDPADNPVFDAANVAITGGTINGVAVAKIQDPANVAITGGTIGGRSVEALAAARPSLSDYGPSNPLYVAHRGSSALYPEQSTVAYARAFADGETALEMDVQTLADGALGVMHDSTVDRTTTGAGNVSSFNSASFQALNMDGSVWLGSNYGDTIHPPLFQTLIDAYKDRAIFAPEDKDQVSMTALLRALVNSGVPFDQALVNSFATTDLSKAVNAGYQAMGISGSGTPTASAIAATGAQWAAVSLTDSLTSFLAAGLKVLVYTVNRRYLRDQFLAQGASGIISSDPTYIRRSAALSTSDYFARQTWAPGMLALSTDGVSDTAFRGAFSAPNWWGYASDSSAGYKGCLQGYLCPVANPQNFTLTYNAIYDAANGGDTNRWLSVFIGETDFPYSDGADATRGYHLYDRLSGALNIGKKNASSAPSPIATTNGPALATGVEYTFKVIVTPTTITKQVFNGASMISSVSVADSTYRGGYIQLGRSGMACRFRYVSVT